MARRVESPSSINTYNQCPRKYYFNYIMRMPMKGNINMIKGKAVHTVLENFFDQFMPDDLDYENAEQKFNKMLFELFSKTWKENEWELKKVGVNEADAAIAINECVDMLHLWSKVFLRRMKDTEKPFKEAFNTLRPKLKEKYLLSNSHAVHGYADVIENIDGKIRVMDYKTSTFAYLTDEYILQLGIYALLFKENFNELPQEVGIYFLKDKEMEKSLSVTPHLLETARSKIEAHHKNTISDRYADYPKRISGLCKWGSGQCDFYDICFHQDGTEKKDPPSVIKA